MEIVVIEIQRYSLRSIVLLILQLPKDTPSSFMIDWEFRSPQCMTPNYPRFVLVLTLLQCVRIYIASHEPSRTGHQGR